MRIRGENRMRRNRRNRELSRLKRGGNHKGNTGGEGLFCHICSPRQNAVWDRETERGRRAIIEMTDAD